jgi:hypothetical protein
MSSTNVTVAVGALGRKLGELWKGLSDTDRRPYEEKAVADKKRYEDQKASYLVSFLIPILKQSSRILTS